MTTVGSAMRTSSPTTLVWLFSRNLVTRGKVVLAVALSAVCLILSVAIRQSSDVAEPDLVMVEFVYLFGLALMVPVLTLVVSTAVLGDLVEDESLVYIWLRPVGRWSIAISAWVAALSLALPIAVTPLVVAVGIGSGGDPRLMAATAGSVTLAVIAYSALFTLLGLVVRRALIVGLGYLFIWELFVARVGEGAATLSINTYPSAALTRWSQVSVPGVEVFGDRSALTSVSVPLAVATVCVALTGYWLTRARVS